MIRKIDINDRALYFELAGEFYQSDAVLHPVPIGNIEATFAELMRSDEYLDCFIIEDDEKKTVGFALIAKTFSQEVGGRVSWIEELYIRESFRGMGFGSAFMKYYEKCMPAGTKRLRLEAEPDNLRAKELYTRLGYKPLPYEQMTKDL